MSGFPGVPEGASGMELAYLPCAVGADLGHTDEFRLPRWSRWGLGTSSLDATGSCLCAMSLVWGHLEERSRLQIPQEPWHGFPPTTLWGRLL